MVPLNQSPTVNVVDKIDAALLDKVKPLLTI